MSAPHDARAERIRRIGIAEGELHVRCLGHGEPVLYLHGVSARGDTWRPVAETVVGRARAWLPDLLGRGASTPRPDVAYDLAAEVGRLERLLDLLAVAEAADTDGPVRAPRVLVGHSHGAALALALAARRPVVRGLLLSNPVSPWVRRPRALDALAAAPVRRAVARTLAPLARPFARAVLARAGGPAYRPAPDRVDAYAAPYRDPVRAETLMRVLADWRPAELDGHLPGRPLDVRIVTGAHDPRIPVRTARRLAERLSAAFTVLDDGGHVLPEQHPETLAAELVRLLDRLGPAGSGAAALDPTR